MIVRILNIILAALVSFWLVSPVQAERAFYSAFSLVPGATALGDLVFTAAATSAIRTNTVDGTDNKSVIMCGGGAQGDSARGGCVLAGGNESGNGGNIVVDSGNISTASIINRLYGANGVWEVRDGAFNILWQITRTGGNLTQDATNGGDIVMSRSGRTLSLQEATASTACMGVATPNGTTNVTITTSCAVTGARVFYSRAGAATNMGTISTTTAPNGTSFTFASTNAADTLASSVVYMIIKEAA